ncbi:MAG: DNA polymerase III subunit delta [Paracoccaceae bacterium]
MKLAGRDATGYFAKPDPTRAGLLIYGADAMRVALRRQEVIEALIGPQGEEEMRLSRMSGADLRKDAALLSDAVKAQSFFPGPRVAFVEEAGDGLAKPIAAALEDWREGDAQIVVTAGTLAAKSALRKAFETHRNAVAIGIYNDPPSRDEIEAELTKAGLGKIDSPAMTDIIALSRVLDPGDFRQTIEKLSLYKLGDNSQVTSADVLNCAPGSSEAAMDDVLNCVAEARDHEIGPIMQRLAAQGVQPVGLCIGATRHFRTLHAAASDPGGPSSGMARMRPPVFGPRRDQMIRQAQAWGVHRLETALQMLTETDLSLRSSQRAPQMAVMERTLIRLAMLGKR